jgi:hypothetical protein
LCFKVENDFEVEFSRPEQIIESRKDFKSQRSAAASNEINFWRHKGFKTIFIQGLSIFFSFNIRIGY